MRRSIAMAGGVLLLGSAGCAGSSAATAAQHPTSSADKPAARMDPAPVPDVPSEQAPGQERVRTADLPGEPESAMGFMFGSGSDVAESTCASAGYDWKKLDARTYHCSGLPDAPGLAGTAFVQTSDAQVYLIRVALNPANPDDPDWLALYDSAMEYLEDRHGEPWKRQHQLPQRCRGEALEDCLERGEAALDATWQWPGGEKVELRMVPPAKARSAAVRLTYSEAP